MRVAATALAVLLAAGGVLAQPHDPAETAVQRGRQLRQEGRDAEAVEEFRTAWVITHSPRARAHMGLAEQALERWLEAEEHLSEALSFTADPWVVRQRTTLEASLATVRGHIAAVRVDGGVEGAEVRVDGRLLGRLPMRAHSRVNAGTVRLTVRAQGYETYERTLELLGGDSRTERVSLRPAGASVDELNDAPRAAAAPMPRPVLRPVRPWNPPPPSTPNPPRDEGTPTLRWVGLGMIGLGVVGAVVSAIEVAGNQSLGEESFNASLADPGRLGSWARFQQQVNSTRGLEASEVCALAELTSGADAEASRGLCSDVRTSATRALAFGLVGGALMGAGALMMVFATPSTAAPERLSRARRANADEGPRIQGLRAEVSPGGASAGLAIAF